MLTLLATVFVLSVLVFVHELGHFLTAKLFKIRVERFSMGYPPRLVGKKIGETDYCISAVPFGGYVKIAGMVDESMDKKQLEEPPKPWEFRSKPWFQRFVVVAAGSIMNLLLTYGVFTAATWKQGVEEPTGTVVGETVEGKPSVLAGLRPNDRIVRVDGKEVRNWEELTEIVHASSGIPLRFEWKRGDSLLSATITPAKEKIMERGEIHEVGLIGILPQVKIRKVGLFEAFGYGGKNFYYWSKLVIVSVARLVSGRESIRSLAGPVAIAKLAGASAKAGFGSLLALMALLSLNLGILNLLPFPVLDGGHILILCIEGIVRRDIPVKVKMVIQQAGMVLLIGLILLVTYNDLFRH